jgi:hypothetical protein
MVRNSIAVLVRAARVVSVLTLFLLQYRGKQLKNGLWHSSPAMERKRNIGIAVKKKFPLQYHT